MTKQYTREACKTIKFQIEQPHAAENREKQGGGTLLLPGSRNDRSKHSVMESRQEDNIPAERLRAAGDNVVKFFTRRNSGQMTGQHP